MNFVIIIVVILTGNVFIVCNGTASVHPLKDDSNNDLRIFEEKRILNEPLRYKGKRRRRDKPFCEKGQVGLFIDNCPTEKPMEFYRQKNIRMKARVNHHQTCNLETKLYYYWLINDVEKPVQEEVRMNRIIYLIEPYSQEIGKVNVFLGVSKEKKYNRQYVATVNCTINIVMDTEVIAKIKGGTNRTVPVNADFEVDASESQNLNFNETGKGLTFQWKCDVHIDSKTSNICPSANKNGPMVLPVQKQYAKKGAIFKFTLTAVMDMDPKPKSPAENTTFQYVYMADNECVLQIKCVKNCPPNPATDIETILEAVCIESCDRINKTGYLWTISDESLDYDKKTKGRHTETFQIEPEAFVSNRTYKVHVKLEGQVHCETNMDIKFHVIPVVKDCKADPESGISGVTKFKVSCSVVTDSKIDDIEIYRMDSGTDSLLTHGKTFDSISFTVSTVSKKEEQVKIVINVTDEHHLIGTNSINIKVKPNDDLKNKSKEDAAKYLEDKYFTDDKVVLSIDQLVSVTDDIMSLGNATTKDGKPLEEKVLKILSKLPLKTPEEATQAAQISGKIVDKFKEKPIASISASATEVCKNAGDAYLKLLKSSKTKGSSVTQGADKMSRILAECSEAATNENPEAVGNIKSNTTTPSSLYEDDTPDYWDDVNQTNAKRDFDKSTSNVIKICYVSGGLNDFTISPKEKPKRERIGNYEVVTSKAFGSEIEMLTVQDAVTLIPSEDFSEQPYTIFSTYMCVFRKNPFWYVWHQKVDTSVVFLQFWSNNKIIENFKQPFLLEFSIKPNLTEQYILRQALIPKKTLNNITNTVELYKAMSVHCISVWQFQGYTVEFVNLTQEDYFDVVITDFSKPTLTEFKANIKKVNSNNNKFFMQHDSNYDGWQFVSLLPSSPRGLHQSSYYYFKVYTYSCLKWNAEMKIWNISCKSHEYSTTETILCECQNASAVAAATSNNHVRLDVEQEFTFRLTLRSYNVIHTVLAVTFALFCILFTLISLESEHTFLDNVYFLSDVPYEYRYGYLIIVQTGNIRNAGTTSNVTIRLTGVKNESKEHVLNYPDPELQMLQRASENWFVMGTPQHLGDMKYITIWFDAIGHNPAWFLSTIAVYDMQTKDHWIFEVEKWFRLSEREEVYSITSNIYEKRQTSKRIRFKKRCIEILGRDQPHTWNIMYYDEHLSKWKRLTIMYSVILTVFTVQVLLYQIPKFDNSDSLNYTGHYHFSFNIIWITAVGFSCAMALHFPVEYFFRKYNKTYLDFTDPFDSDKCGVLVTNVCWSILCFNIVSCMTVLIIFGFWIPSVISFFWLTTVLASLLMYVLLFANIFRQVYYLILKRKKEVDITKSYEKVLKHINRQRSYIYKAFGKPSLRRYFKHLYQPPENAVLQERKTWIIEKTRIIEMLVDLIMIIMYVILLYWVVLTSRSEPNAIYNSKQIASLLKGEQAGTFNLSHVHNINDIYKFLNKTLLPTLHLHELSHEHADRGVLIDHTNYVMGIIRYRQQRVKTDSCIVPKFMKRLNLTCRPEYSWNVAETEDFNEGWEKQKQKNAFSRMSDIWIHQTADKTGSSMEQGRFGLYPGYGYIAYDARAYRKSLINYEYLLTHKWLDFRTRVLFIEFLTYNVNTNMFVYSELRFELSATGDFAYRVRAHPAKLIVADYEKTSMRIVVITSFFIILSILFLKILYRIGTHITVFYRDVWILIDIFIIALNIGVVLYIARRPELVKEYMDELVKHKSGRFVSYFWLFDTEVALTILAAFLIFISTLRLCKLLKFVFLFKVLMKALKDAAGTLVALVFIQAVVVTGFVFVFILAVGDQLPEFISYRDSYVFLLLRFVNLQKEFDARRLPMMYERLVYCIYMYFSIIINNVYITILVLQYKQATIDYSNQGSDNVVKYLKEQYVYYRALARVTLYSLRLRGGAADSDRTVIPKSDQHRYAEMLQVSTRRMKAMTSVAKCVIVNSHRSAAHLKEGDYDLMRDAILHLFPKNQESEEEVTSYEKFYYARDFKHNKVEMVDDRRFEKMEEFLEEMLGAEKRTKRMQMRDIFIRKVTKTRVNRLNDINETLEKISDLLNRVHIQGP